MNGAKAVTIDKGRRVSTHMREENMPRKATAQASQQDIIPIGAEKRRHPRYPVEYRLRYNGGLGAGMYAAKGCWSTCLSKDVEYREAARLNEDIS
jgi:hypothetical protein